MSSIEFEVTFNASPEALFNAWYKTELLQQWFCPGDMVITQVMSSFQEGGRFRFIMREPDFTEYVLLGEYTVVTPGEQLSFTWQWQGEGHHTQVDVTFTPRNASTSAIRLVHSGFTDEEDRQLHEQAWIACLEKLSTVTL